MPWYAVAALVVTAVGTGISVYSQQQQAKSQAAIAEYNFNVQRRNAEIQQKFAEYEAEANVQMFKSQAEAQQRNADIIKQQAVAEQQTAIINAHRERQDFRRLEAIQRARIAKSGVVESGSPLEILSETAGLAELSILENLHQSELKQIQLRREAEIQEHGAGLTMMQADYAKFQGASAKVGAQQARTAAQIGYLTSMADARATRTSSYGTLLTGLGSAASGYYSATNYMPRATA